MTSGSFRFDPFLLDPVNRQLRRDGVPVELNSRYLDVLLLLVREGGGLVTKDRFMAEVWRGVPVTDEALTQCIRTLRRALGDDAASPRFIETVPKHGYRFVAPVEVIDEGERTAGTAAVPAAEAGTPSPWRRILPPGLAGTAGGGVAGVVGGLFYGFAAAAQPGQGAGAASVLLVLLCITTLLALIGGAGVAFGIAAAGLADDRRWMVAGGAGGGLVVGAAVKLLGLDAFNLLFGRAPGDMTGAAEGALLGGAVGLGAWLGGRGSGSLRRGVGVGGLVGGVAGVLIVLAGGRLMGGSLHLLAQVFPGSRLRLDQLGRLFGEGGFGPAAQAITGGLEGALFGACIVGAMLLARRGRSGTR